MPGQLWLSSSAVGQTEDTKLTGQGVETVYWVWYIFWRYRYAIFKSKIMRMYGIPAEYGIPTGHF